jgi:hypothetical protein
LASAAAMITSAGALAASPYDTCILEHMSGVTSDTAADSIKEACIRNAEKPLPNSVLDTFATAVAWFGTLPFPYQNDSGLYIKFNNTSGYTLTEIVIQITETATGKTENYVERRFPTPPPPGAIMMPPSYGMIKPGANEFYTPINQTVKDPKSWGKTYSWNVISAKGF